MLDSWSPATSDLIFLSSIKIKPRNCTSGYQYINYNYTFIYFVTHLTHNSFVESYKRGCLGMKGTRWKHTPGGCLIFHHVTSYFEKSFLCFAMIMTIAKTKLHVSGQKHSRKFIYCTHTYKALRGQRFSPQLLTLCNIKYLLCSSVHCMSWSFS